MYPQLTKTEKIDNNFHINKLHCAHGMLKPAMVHTKHDTKLKYKTNTNTAIGFETWWLHTIYNVCSWHKGRVTEHTLVKD